MNKYMKFELALIFGIITLIFLIGGITIYLSEPYVPHCPCDYECQEIQETVERIELYYDLETNETLYHEDGVYDEGWEILNETE